MFSGPTRLVTSQHVSAWGRADSFEDQRPDPASGVQRLQGDRLGDGDDRKS